jgi:hypothetical protein
MNKPISVAIDELRENLTNVINTCGLHISIVDTVVAQIYGEVHHKEREIFESEKAKYIEEIKKES